MLTSLTLLLFYSFSPMQLQSNLDYLQAIPGTCTSWNLELKFCVPIPKKEHLWFLGGTKVSHNCQSGPLRGSGLFQLFSIC